MSWTQGIMVREEIPQPLLAILDAKSEGYAEAIVWDTQTPHDFGVMYYKDGIYFESQSFTLKGKHYVRDSVSDYLDR